MKKWSHKFLNETESEIHQGILIGDVVHLVIPLGPEDKATKFTLTPCGWKIPVDMYTPPGISFSFIGHPMMQDIQEQDGKPYMMVKEAYIEPILTFERIK